MNRWLFAAFGVALGAGILGACSSSTPAASGPQCGSTGTVCGDTCAELASDNANCGACGQACAAGQICSKGVCAASCGGGTTQCGSTCNDTKVDSNNCGACGTKCTAGQVCSSGKCASSCAMGQTTCGASCVNTMTDNANCGACGTVCQSGQVCSSGKCALSCQKGLTLCTSGADAGAPSEAGVDSGSTLNVPYCANTQTDDGNCGACGVQCSAGQQCQGGACSTTCGGAQTLCAGQDGGASYCSDMSSDPSNCGACGAACPSGQACVAKFCKKVVTALKCADFTNNGNNYQQYCFKVNAQTVCIGQTAGGAISCTNTATGIHFVFDYASTWPMRFTNNTATCQNYHPTYIANLATALGYSKYTINQTKTGNSCTRTYLDANLVFQSTAGDFTQAQIYDINFDN